MLWDLRLATRSLAIAASAAFLVLVVVTATDDASGWARRLALVGALLPVAGAIGAFAATRAAEVRGEIAALSAIGVEPFRARRGAALGGVLVGALGPLLMASRRVDLSALFPTTARPVTWVVEGESVRAIELGLRVSSTGVSLAATEPLASLRHDPRLATVASVALLALACPVWSSLAPSRRRAWVGALAIGATILAFQAVAADRAPALALLAAPAILVLDVALARYRDARA